MLAVAVDLDGDVVAALEREAVPRLHGTADAEVERQPQHVRAAVGGHARRAVGRAVVDDDDVEVGIEAADLVDHAADGRLLVQRRDDGDALEVGELREDVVARRRRDCGELSHRRHTGS